MIGVGPRLTYPQYLGITLNRERINEARAGEVLRGIELAFGARPAFREVCESPQEAAAAEKRWEADKREQEAMKGHGGGASSPENTF